MCRMAAESNLKMVEAPEKDSTRVYYMLVVPYLVVGTIDLFGGKPQKTIN